MERNGDSGVLEATYCEGLQECDIEIVNWELWRNVISDFKPFKEMSQSLKKHYYLLEL